MSFAKKHMLFEPLLIWPSLNIKSQFFHENKTKKLDWHTMKKQIYKKRNLQINQFTLIMNQSPELLNKMTPSVGGWKLELNSY